jgi:hypothetical protein
MHSQRAGRFTVFLFMIVGEFIPSEPPPKKSSSTKAHLLIILNETPTAARLNLVIFSVVYSLIERVSEGGFLSSCGFFGFGIGRPSQPIKDEPVYF